MMRWLVSLVKVRGMKKVINCANMSTSLHVEIDGLRGINSSALRQVTRVTIFRVLMSLQPITVTVYMQLKEPIKPLTVM